MNTINGNIQTLLSSLEEEQIVLQAERANLIGQHDALKRSRLTVARMCLEELVPDLGGKTIKALEKEVHGFRVPRVSTWFGLGSKLDPMVTVTSLRTQLGAYLDNTAGTVPVRWQEEVQSIDVNIRNLQEKLLQNVERVNAVGDRKRALRKLQSIDMSRMRSDMREKLGHALASQAAFARQSVRPFANVQTVVPQRASYPTVTETQSSSGISLLEMWIWYELLSSHSSYAHEVSRINIGDGHGGGGGASAAWGSPREVAPQEMSTTDARETGVSLAVLDHASNDGAGRSNEDLLATHANLGSRSFS